MSKNHKQHKVTRHEWKDGKLTVLEDMFENLVDALAFVEEVAAEAFHIHDCDDELVCMGRHHHHHHHHHHHYA